jgi:hypothetical protein
VLEHLALLFGGNTWSADACEHAYFNPRPGNYLRLERTTPNTFPDRSKKGPEQIFSRLRHGRALRGPQMAPPPPTPTEPMGE